MVEFISGILRAQKPAEVIVEVNGVGYGVLIPTSTYERLPPKNEKVKLHTHLYVRDDALRLFGFATEPERAVFRLMITVAGVGPKIALAALSAMSPRELRRHIMAKDSPMLTRIQGVGRKTADRLVVELHDRVAALMLEDTVPEGSAQARADALAGLETLGFTRAAAERRLRMVQRKHPTATTASDLIRLALQA